MSPRSPYSSGMASFCPWVPMGLLVHPARPLVHLKAFRDGGIGLGPRLSQSFASQRFHLALRSLSELRSSPAAFSLAMRTSSITPSASPPEIASATAAIHGAAVFRTSSTPFQ